jgi:hypothetical protein
MQREIQQSTQPLRTNLRKARDPRGIEHAVPHDAQPARPFRNQDRAIWLNPFTTVSRIWCCIAVSRTIGPSGSGRRIPGDGRRRSRRTSRAAPRSSIRAWLLRV